MILNDEELGIAQENARRLEAFLMEARKTLPSEEYRRIAEPFLLELQQRQAEVVEYLSAAEREKAA
jgi:hypothetical protein